MKQIKPRQKSITAEALLDLSHDGRRRELMAGEVVEVPPAGYGHGRVSSRLLRRVADWVEDHSLGDVLAAETGFVLRRDPDTVRAPDLAFIVQDRLPDPSDHGFSAVVPDLVAEVVSPSDRVAEVMAKVGDWLDAGVKVVWVVWPAERRITVFRSGSDISLLGEHDTLTCPELLPGLAVAVAAVLG